MSVNNLFHSPALNKGPTGCVTSKTAITPEQLEELREFLEELDCVPLSAFPAELWPYIYQHQHDIRNENIPFHPLEEPFYKNLNAKLREREKLRKSIKNEQFELLI